MFGRVLNSENFLKRLSALNGDAILFCTYPIINYVVMVGGVNLWHSYTNMMEIASRSGWIIKTCHLDYPNGS